MRKVKVLHIIPAFVTGGAEKLVLDLILNYDKERFEIAALSFKSKANRIFEQELEKKGLHIFYLDKKNGFDCLLFFKISKVLKKFKPDIIHSHLYVLKYALLPVIFNGIPVKFHTVHSIASKEQRGIARIVYSMAYKYFGVVPIAISANIKETIVDYYRFHNGYIPVILNGIDTNRFKNCHRPTNSKIKLLHIGRFNIAKNHDLMIDAFKEVVDKGYDIQLVLVGDGELKSKIVEKVQKLGLESHVEFLGIRNDIPDLLAQSDIFILPSSWEGLPIVLLEAMAAGVPIIATKVGGVPEIVQNNVNGFLVEPNNRDSIVRAIIELVHSKELRETMGHNSIEYITKFDIRTTQKSYEELYLQLLTGSSPEIKALRGKSEDFIGK